MAGAAIGEDMAAARQPLNGKGERAIGLQIGQVNLVYEFQIRLRVHAMHFDQATQRGAMLPVQGFLHRAGGVFFHTQIAGDEFGHARINPREQPAIGAIQRIVQIEHPMRHMAEIGTPVFGT